MNKKKRYNILSRLEAENFHSHTDLKYSSPFELLIAVLLSAKTTNIAVNKVTDQLFQIANTPQAMLSLGIDGIKNHIKSIGLFNRKAENIIKTCQFLLERHRGEVPESRFALEALPGVGRKTSNVVLNVIFNWPTIAVDTHVFRVANRTRFAVGKNVKSVEKKLLSVVPKRFHTNCHRWLMLHGRYTCTAYAPSCDFCLIEDLCEYSKKQYHSK